MNKKSCIKILQKLEWKSLIPANYSDDKCHLVEYSIFENLSKEEITELVNRHSNASHMLNSAIGCLVGLAVGDSVGAPVEFKNAVSTDQIPHGKGLFYVHIQKKSASKSSSRNFSFLRKIKFRNGKKSRTTNSKKENSKSILVPTTDDQLHELHYKYPMLNKFFLKPGQYTDDTSMALCLADSLIYASSKRLMKLKGTDSFYSTQIKDEVNSVENDLDFFTNESLDKMLSIEENGSHNGNIAVDPSLDLVQVFDGKDLRLRFFSWWNQGYNNCFRFDTERPTRVSVGLGGNIAASLRQISKVKSKQEVPSKFVKESDDAGNGSLMRLAPVAIRFCNNIDLAIQVAKEQSEATHPGTLASEACQFLCYILVNAINHNLSTDIKRENIKVFLDSVVSQYLKSYKSIISSTFLRLLEANEDPTSLEENWNWRSNILPLSEICERRLKFDGTYKYNGYPVIPGYFGAFAPDGLAIALFAAYNTSTFDDAIQLCVDHLGDADTTAAICGQICGAFYGLDSINPIFKENLSVWDGNEIALRSIILLSLQTL